jgi:Domain of unknown function (DUF4150)
MSQVAARKQMGWIVVFDTPDVCKTPMGSSTPPVPYPVTALLTDCIQAVESVKANGHPVVVYDQTKVSKTLGDMAGVATGVKSSTVGALCWPLKYSKTVKAGKRNLVRDGDKFGMNGQ